MSYNQFDIFHKDSKFRLSANMVVYAILGLSIPTAFFADKYYGDSLIEQIGLYGIFLGFGLSIFLKWFQLVIRKTLKGEISGLIEFHKDSIIVEHEKYLLSEIDKIELSTEDYLDRPEPVMYGDFNPTLSTGTDNYCRMVLKNGTSKEVYFQIEMKNDFLKLREELIEYHRQGKFSWLKLIEHLKIDKYEEIQEFKQTLPPTTAM
jgi:hypothetical protein